VPALLMVSTIRFRSFKELDFGYGPRYRLALVILLIVVIYAQPEISLVVLAYGYLLSAFIGLAITRWRARREGLPPATSP
jgi:phosphatidylserine synthase